MQGFVPVPVTVIPAVEEVVLVPVPVVYLYLYGLYLNLMVVSDPVGILAASVEFLLESVCVLPALVEGDVPALSV